MIFGIRTVNSTTLLLNLLANLKNLHRLEVQWTGGKCVHDVLRAEGIYLRKGTWLVLGNVSSVQPSRFSFVKKYMEITELICESLMKIDACFSENEHRAEWVWFIMLELCHTNQQD